MPTRIYIQCGPPGPVAAAPDRPQPHCTIRLTQACTQPNPLRRNAQNCQLSCRRTAGEPAQSLQRPDVRLRQAAVAGAGGDKQQPNACFAATTPLQPGVAASATVAAPPRLAREHERRSTPASQFACGTARQRPAAPPRGQTHDRPKPVALAAPRRYRV